MKNSKMCDSKIVQKDGWPSRCGTIKKRRKVRGAKGEPKRRRHRTKRRWWCTKNRRFIQIRRLWKRQSHWERVQNYCRTASMTQQKPANCNCSPFRGLSLLHYSDFSCLKYVWPPRSSFCRYCTKYNVFQIITFWTSEVCRKSQEGFRNLGNVFRGLWGVSGLWEGRHVASEL